MERLKAVIEVYLTDESMLEGREFVPEPTDVTISTASKSGPTWFQQICHGLRSGGSMEFEITMVIPCLEMAGSYNYGYLHKSQGYLPRMYKTHFWRPYCPKGAGKYIIVSRRPSDAAASLHFYEGWFFPVGDLSLEDFIKGLYLKGCDVVSWYPHRHDENVLWLHYEDLQQDLPECVRLIADFLDVGSGDRALQQLVTKQASFDFMKQHWRQFDEHPLKLARNEAVGLPQDAGLRADCGKVRVGSVHGSKMTMPEHLHALIEQRWREVMTPETGYQTYDEMRDKINQELKRSFGGKK